MPVRVEDVGQLRHVALLLVHVIDDDRRDLARRGLRRGRAARAAGRRRAARRRTRGDPRARASSANGRPSASFAAASACRQPSPGSALESLRRACAIARVRLAETRTRGELHRGLRSISVCSVDDAQALATGRDRRRRLILRIDLGRDRDDADFFLLRLRGRALRAICEELARAPPRAPSSSLPVTRVDDACS